MGMCWSVHNIKVLIIRETNNSRNSNDEVSNHGVCFQGGKAAT